MATKGIWLPIEVIQDKNLTHIEKLLLMEISQLSMMDKGCIASNSHFAQILLINKNGVSRSINKLVFKGYITTKIQSGSRNHLREILIIKRYPQNDSTYPQNDSKVPPKCLESKESITINKTYSYFKKKFAFIDELHFNKMVKHLEKKFNPLTKVRITNNIKKLKNNTSLYAKAVNQMIELDYSGLFIPTHKQHQEIEYTSLVQPPEEFWDRIEAYND